MGGSVDNYMRRLHTYFNHCCLSARRAIRESRGEAIDLLRKVIKEAEECEPNARLVPDFVQFVVAAHALDHALRRGELSEMGNWIGWSLSEDVTDSPEVELHVGRVANFFQSPSVFLWPGFVPTFVVYFLGFYHYARLRTAMKQIGEQLWGAANLTLKVLFSDPPKDVDPTEIFLVSDMLAWAALESPSRAKELTPFVEELVNLGELPRWARSTICVTLATNAGRFSTKLPAQWAKMALDEFSDCLEREQRAQMLITVMDAAGNSCEVEDILTEIRGVQVRQKKTMKPIDFFRDAALREYTVRPFFSKCLNIPRLDFFILGVKYWYQIEDGADQIDPLSVLVTMPFGGDGYVAAYRSIKQEVISDRQVLLEKLTRETDTFLGTMNTVVNADNSELLVPERLGVPSGLTDTDWALILADAYCPDSIACPEGVSCQLVLPTKGHPIQAVQLNAWGTTWPIASSLLKPRPDRPISSVALWSGGGSMTEGMEIEAVERAFTNRGIAVHKFSPGSCSAENFLAIYQNREYDVFWVASHGEFDHWSPKQVTLQISHDRASVSLDELWEKAPLSDARRLLVLNVCDGARFEETGLLPKIGLAPALAGPSQATISHLWPVRGFPSAAFGAYLAHFLSQGVPYFDAYIQAIQAMKKSATDIAEHLQGLYGDRLELVERLLQMNEDFSPIQISGSAAFFQ